MNIHATAADLTSAEKIANAVLYEGYILYPYRPSSVKNRQRWTFGGVYPHSYRGETSSQQTQVLISGDDSARLDVHVRFLHLVSRVVKDSNDCPVESLRANKKTYNTWQEAVERGVHSDFIALRELCVEPRRVDFAFHASYETEVLKEDAQVVGSLVRTQFAVQGAVELFAEKVADGLYRVTELIENLTPLDPAAPKTREDASLRAFVSTHSILTGLGGEFVSLMDPPDEYRGFAASCKNNGAYPVLVGEQGTHSMMLSSPIILYDYPQIGAESAGDLFDGTEIDEILSLRILTLTDAEKQELRETDARSAAMLDRTEALSPEAFARLHGTVRNVEPANDWRIPTPGDWNGADLERDRVAIESVQVGGVPLRSGDSVRIRPKRSADVMDLLLDGRAATIESIEQDYEERIYLALTVNDDPGRDFGTERFIAHRFFYSIEEVEPL